MTMYQALKQLYEQYNIPDDVVEIITKYIQMNYMKDTLSFTTSKRLKRLTEKMKRSQVRIKDTHPGRFICRALEPTMEYFRPEIFNKNDKINLNGVWISSSRCYHYGNPTNQDGHYRLSYDCREQIRDWTKVKIADKLKEYNEHRFTDTIKYKSSMSKSQLLKLLMYAEVLER